MTRKQRIAAGLPVRALAPEPQRLPRGGYRRHPHGKGNILAGKNNAQRTRIKAAFGRFTQFASLRDIQF